MFLKLPKIVIIFQNKWMNFFLLTNCSNFKGCFTLYKFLISEMSSLIQTYCNMIMIYSHFLFIFKKAFQPGQGGGAKKSESLQEIN